MAWEGEYEPNPHNWVADHVARYEESNGTKGRTMNGRPVVILTTRGAKSGKIRKVPLMRVSDGTRYAVVASLGGAPKHPVWYYNLVAHPDEVRLQDGPVVKEYRARLAEGAEREEWWARAVEDCRIPHPLESSDGPHMRAARLLGGETGPHARAPLGGHRYARLSREVLQHCNTHRRT